MQRCDLRQVERHGEQVKISCAGKPDVDAQRGRLAISRLTRPPDRWALCVCLHPFNQAISRLRAQCASFGPDVGTLDVARVLPHSGAGAYLVLVSGSQSVCGVFPRGGRQPTMSPDLEE